MKISHESQNEVTVVTIVGDVLDASVVGDFKSEMTPLLKSQSRIVFDMENIQFVDSSGVGAILSCLRTLNAEGGDLKICSLTKPVRALFELVRMHKIFEIFDTRDLAMESFKKLMPYDKENPFAQYASFYYALSAYKQNYKSVSKDMLNQIKILYPEWEKMDEVNYWLAIHLFEAGDSFQALKILNSIRNKSLASDVTKAKQHYLSAITDPETLRMMLEEYPKDEIIGISLASCLSKNLTTTDERRELEKRAMAGRS